MDNAYSIAPSGGFADKCAFQVRMKIHGVLRREIDLLALDSILDVGVTTEKTKLSSNFFENMFPEKNKLTALSNQDASWLEEVYPGLKFVRGDGRDLPFEDNRYELVFSSAVLEHVGSLKDQERFIQECVRVSKRYVFLTTPNRWHPIELHTALPFLHWLPKSMHRAILRMLGIKDLALEENLNLLDKRALRNICEHMDNIRNFKILSVRFLGIPSNLLLLIEKTKNQHS